MMPLSAIIPTLNAADTLPATMAALGGVAEIIVVDGGSGDVTARIAAECGARVLAAARGRGVQLAVGVAAARGAWLLLLHADTRLAPGWADDAACHIAAGEDRAGYFRFALDSADPRARKLERAVAWRCRVLALPYGDQGLLISSRLLAKIGGVKPIPLMEDVDLARRLGRSRLAPLAAEALTSAAKWEREGWRRRSARNLACLSLWFAGVPPKFIESLYL